ncbi:related to U3 snoRNP protein [Cephalotrichum gorgonifer]|uniref:U3 small nucleolar ribonucleoprotein protein MPP10 n=1 Tax=Cephalotrichum gorgonifer TaxID=2041049 RepID=A0AAE8SZ65_9PEZI|nr:related to U3 snoRNP protein [Cephalotrichum gorgonifer]
MAEGSITSSITSTSHTLTNATGMSPPAPVLGGANPLALLETINRSNRHAFLQPPAAIPSASLNLVKDTLESFAGRVGDEQLQRVRDANRKRKRSERIRVDDAEVLKIRKIHVDGFETGQVWQQAKRIIASTLKSSEEALKELEELNGVTANGHAEEDENDSASSDSEEEDSGDEEDEEDDISALDSEMGDVDLDGLQEEGEDDDDEGDGMEGFDEEEEESEEDDAAEPFVEDVHGLNDGFFSIDDFNKQTQMFEEQDARGDPNTDMASDDEEIDWDADPYAPAATAKSSKKQQSKGKKSKKDDDPELDIGVDEEEEDDEEDGPTFGNMDLYAPEGDSDVEFDELDPEADDEGENANDVFYKDFFAPPQRKSDTERKRSKRARFEPDEVDIDRTMEAVKRDLFEDLSDMEDSDDALSDASAGNPKSRRSAHERRQAKIAEEIRKLEAANVAKRQWTLAGEATAGERPTNSLLEQDLDFEHVGKPVPVITPEVTESIEELIKRRILADEFDDVLRRRPGAENDAAATRRGLTEVDDTKSKKGLAEIYEEEHVKNANPDTYVSQADAKLQREEAEVQAMWADVVAKLDALSSWHYKPRPAGPTLTVVSDVATVAMEDAQPATAQGVAGGESMIAPQEVYRAGKDNAEEGEVSRGGVPIARQEMTREEKTRRRRRAKERIRKSGNGEAAAKKPAAAADGGKASKKDTMADLKRGGVRVINRKGEILDVEGNKEKSARAVSSGGYKL